MMRKDKRKQVLNAALLKAVNVMIFQRRLAAAIGTKQQNVWSWLYITGVVPAEHVLAIEKATKERGSIVTRHELRPDIYPTEIEVA
jgi:DNA-binding transcriptional regulator YdaS (Cro superfamily)